MKKISRGYGFVTEKTGKRIETVEQVKTGDTVNIRILDGQIKAKVSEVIKSGSSS